MIINRTSTEKKVISEFYSTPTFARTDDEIDEAFLNIGAPKESARKTRALESCTVAQLQ